MGYAQVSGSTRNFARPILRAKALVGNGVRFQLLNYYRYFKITEMLEESKEGKWSPLFKNKRQKGICTVKSVIY